MGGMGSGRWHTHVAKNLVDDALVLPISRVKQAINLVADMESSVSQVDDSLYWKQGGRVIGTIEFSVRLDPVVPLVYLSYNVTRHGEKTFYSYPVRVVASFPNYGGLRWWWLCPLIRDGRPCSRRVAKLYLPNSGRYFGCRHCNDLTYRSCRENHQFDLLNSILGMKDFDAKVAVDLLVKGRRR